MEAVRRYQGRWIVVKKVDGKFVAAIRRIGVHPDRDLPVAADSEDEAFKLAMKFIDEVPETDSSPQ